MPAAERLPVAGSAPACRSCGDGSSRRLLALDARDPGLARGRYDVLRCEACGLVYAWPDPPAVDLAHTYGGRTERVSPEAAARFERWAARRHWLPLLDQIERLVPHGSLLDVGCGEGAFLALAAGRGFAVSGLDPDPGRVATARARLGDVVQVGSIESIERADREGGRDVVRLCHVLEHVVDPARALRAAHRALRRGGILSLALPIVEEPIQWILERIPGDRVRQKAYRGLGWLFPPEHLTSWTTGALDRAIAAAGFEPVFRAYRSDVFPWEKGLRKAFIVYRAVGIGLRLIGSGVNVEMLARRR